MSSSVLNWFRIVYYREMLQRYFELSYINIRQRGVFKVLFVRNNLQNSFRVDAENVRHLHEDKQ